MIETIDADDAWWPPTFTPDGVCADPVGVVDDRRRQPQHAVLDRVSAASEVGPVSRRPSRARCSLPTAIRIQSATMIHRRHMTLQYLRLNPAHRRLRSLRGTRRPRCNSTSGSSSCSSTDGRRSASEVGRLVGLSPAAAKRRIDRLEQIGVIRGYTRDPRPPAARRAARGVLRAAVRSRDPGRRHRLGRRGPAGAGRVVHARRRSRRPGPRARHRRRPPQARDRPGSPRSPGWRSDPRHQDPDRARKSHRAVREPELVQTRPGLPHS